MYLGRILVVDEDAVLRNAMLGLFKALGYGAYGVQSGFDAVKVLQTHAVDLVVTEYNMTSGSLGGRDILETIVQAGLDTDVIVSSATGTISDAVIAIRLGARNFLVKPLSPELLKREIRQVFRERWERASRAAVSPRVAVPALVLDAGPARPIPTIRETPQTPSQALTVTEGDTIDLLGADGADSIHVEVELEDPIPAPRRSSPRPTPDGATMLGRYKLRRLIGRGGMGEVYEAHDPLLDRVVAIKVINLAPGGESRAVVLARFKREASVAARLTHPNIAPIYDIEIDQDVSRVFFVMEFVQGESLRFLLQRTKTFSFARTLSAAYRLVDALEYVHANAVVHRDIKPENILLGADDQLKIVDFGVAKVPVSTLTDAHFVVGSPSYLAPESIACQPVDYRSDQFSLATVLMKMLSGRSVFKGRTFEDTLRNVALAKPPKLKDLGVRVPRQFEETIEQMHAKDPKDRFQDEVELLNRLAGMGERLALRLTSALHRPPTLGRASSPPSDRATATLAGPVTITAR